MSDTTAPLSALFWWIIPLTALTGAIIYVVWVTKFKSKFENRVDRSVGRFQRFQDSLAPTNGAKTNGATQEPREAPKGKATDESKSEPNSETRLANGTGS